MEEQLGAILASERIVGKRPRPAADWYEAGSILAAQRSHGSIISADGEWPVKSAARAANAEKKPAGRGAMAKLAERQNRA